MSKAKELYPYDDIDVMISCAKIASTVELNESGINIYVNSFGEDGKGHDIHIDPKDTVAVELFRVFTDRLVDHFTNMSDRNIECSWTGKNNEIIKVIGAASKDEALSAATKYASGASIEEGYLFNWTLSGPQPDWWQDYYLFKIETA